MKKAQVFFKQNFSFRETIKKVITDSNNYLLQNLERIEKEQEDIILVIKDEIDLLGHNITYHYTDLYNFFSDKKCIDFIYGAKEGYLCVHIDSCFVYKTKEKRNMAFLTVSDNSCTIELMVLPDEYDAFREHLYEGNIIGCLVVSDREYLKLLGVSYAKSFSGG
ncbi:MAG: hypothetical protein SNJ64_02205 [Endomicrobiia bacterium]